MTVNPEAKPGEENKKRRRNKMLEDKIRRSPLEGEGRLQTIKRTLKEKINKTYLEKWRSDSICVPE